MVRPITPDTYFIGAIIDPQNSVIEANEKNNVSGTTTFNLAAPPCTPESSEEDDTAETSTPTSVGQSFIRNECDNRQDWFSFSTNESEVHVFNGRVSQSESVVSSSIKPHLISE